METWVNQINARASILIEQMLVAQKVGEQVSEEIGRGMVDLYRQKLFDLYREELPIAQLLDASDLVLHAEGPDAKESLPSLHAVNWIISNTEKQLRLLSRSLFDLSASHSRRFGQQLDLRLTGFAAGSIYAGVCLAPPAADLHGPGEHEPTFQTVRAAIRKLPIIPTFVEEESMSPGIFDAYPDPAQRDAGMSAAYHLAPTGKMGIHTLEIFAPGEAPSELSQRERVVIREALKRPLLRESRQGAFVGEMREIDLDKTRFHLRGVAGIGSIRCVMREVTAEKARPWLGAKVRVEGEYEMDQEGRPRLLLVSDISPIHEPIQERWWSL